MPSYKAPVADTMFLLTSVFPIERHNNLPGFADASADVVEAILGEAGKFAEEVLAPLNRSGDLEGCTRHDDGSITTPAGFKDAYRQLCEGGWLGISAPEAFGGQGLPATLTSLVNEYLISANIAFSMYPGLVQGAVAALMVHGTEAQRQTYLPKMVSGEWAGTMDLTEPHCGTDLGQIRTRAVKQADGSYRITGTKIFISGGEQDLTENIVHLVLARIEGAPAGTKGISLFVVPKLLVNGDGSLGDRNGVACGSIEHKMGIHGSATCVMNYDDAQGWLVGEEHRGLAAMFTMMNEARIGVGLQGYAVADAAYQNAVAYARDRLQGRAVTGDANPAGPADPLIVHPDIRRNLMDQKSFLEGARMLATWCAHLIDRSHIAEDAEAEGLVSLLTPVVKGFLTDKGFETTVLAQQVFGGHGFIEEQGMSQFVRDSRITMIYEGANGVQALDLVGRKLAAEGGKPMMRFFELVKAEIKAHEADEELRASFLDPLKSASKHLQTATMFFMEQAMKNPNAALAGSYDFMHLFGHVALGLMWTRMAAASRKALAEGASDGDFYESKIATGRYYMARQLPMTATHLARIQSGADPVMALAENRF